MIKLLLMSHFHLAGGLKDTLSYFNETAANQITAINAYADDCDPKPLLDEFIQSLNDEDKGLIFTDIMGGSVNQLCIPYLTKPNVFVFSGMNLPMLLQATCLSGEESSEEIKALEQVGKEGVVCMNDYQFASFSEEDE